VSFEGEKRNDIIAVPPKTGVKKNIVQLNQIDSA